MGSLACMKQREERRRFWTAVVAGFEGSGKSRSEFAAEAAAGKRGSTGSPRHDQTWSMGPLADDDDCGWKTRATDLEVKLEETSAKLDAVVAKVAAMERRILGHNSEKLPPIDMEVREQRPVDPAATHATGRKSAELRAVRVVTEDVPTRCRRPTAPG